jgi:hypothetical protein
MENVVENVDGEQDIAKFIQEKQTSARVPHPDDIVFYPIPLVNYSITINVYVN